MPAVGIDLGTTNSCVGVYRKNQIEIIINEQGNRVTPSFVSFTDTETLVGDAAKSEAPFNFKNTLFQMKRLIGRKYDDPVVQADMKLWGFSVINDDNTPKIPVISDNGRQIFRPEEISAFVLKSLIKSAKLRLEEDITDAVITVPAYFNNAQRRATLDAGKLAGLNVVRMINEPTAAAIAYGLDTQETGEQKVLVFDLGGGTFDVTIVDINGCDIDVLATGGDTHLGGDDFDNRMVKHFVTEFKNKNESDMSDNKLGMNRLRVACEAAKRNLSSMTSTTVQVDGLHNGIHFRSKISRARFEELNYDFFTKMMETVKNALSDANICKEEIDNIVLVGGSTRIPKVEGILKDFFKEVNISRTINPDEAVAYGAAALAAKISSGGSAQLDKLVLHDVTPLSLGWKDSTGEMQVVVKRNTKIPTKSTTTSTTTIDYQTSVCLKVYEGERLAAEDNHFLGSFSLYDIPPALKGVEKFEISFVLDENGILVVNERCLSTGEENEMTIGNEGRLSVAEVASMIRKARLCSEKDQAWKKRRDQMHNLENFVYGVKHSLYDKKFKRNITDGDKEIIVEKCDEILEWIDAEENPEIHRSINKQKDLEKTCRPIFHKIPGGQDYLDKLKK